MPASIGAQTSGVVPIVGVRAIYEGGGMSVFYDGFNGDDEKDYDNFLGIAIGKKARSRKEEERKIKLYNKESRGYARRSKADARLALAQQGIVTPSTGSAISSSLGTLGSLASTFTGGGGGGGGMTRAPEPVEPTIGERQTADSMNADADKTNISYGDFRAGRAGADLPPDKEKNKNLPYIIGGIVLLVVAMAFLIKKK